MLFEQIASYLKHVEMFQNVAFNQNVAGIER